MSIFLLTTALFIVILIGARFFVLENELRELREECIKTRKNADEAYRIALNLHMTLSGKYRNIPKPRVTPPQPQTSKNNIIFINKDKK